MNVSTMFLAFLPQNLTGNPTHEVSLVISLTFDVSFPCLGQHLQPNMKETCGECLAIRSWVDHTTR